MRQLKLIFVLLLAALYMPTLFSQSLTGMWTTIDDKTGKKRAVVDLFISGDTLNGKIIRVYSQAGDTGICSKCPDHFKDKPIEGLQFLWGLKKNRHGIWDGGQILDAKTGKIYRVKLKMDDNKLFVRGYVGISILGRTQIWVR